MMNKLGALCFGSGEKSLQKSISTDSMKDTASGLLSYMLLQSCPYEICFSNTHMLLCSSSVSCHRNSTSPVGCSSEIQLYNSIFFFTDFLSVTFPSSPFCPRGSCSIIPTVF